MLLRMSTGDATFIVSVDGRDNGAQLNIRKLPSLYIVERAH